MRLDDGATKIFLNTEGILKDADEGLKNFLEYVAHGTIADDFVKELDAAVQEIKFGEKVRLEYMTLELFIQEREEKARKEAFKEGREEERFDFVKKMLARKIPLGDIVGISGWSKEKILKLAEEIKNEN